MTSVGCGDEEGEVVTSQLPDQGTLATGTIPPLRGFKRFVVDKELAPRRIVKYEQRYLDPTACKA